MKTIYTLSIECLFGANLEERFLRVVEVSADMTLGDMHLLIQKLTGFDNDHLSTFYSANTYSGTKVWFTETGRRKEDYDNIDSGLWGIPLHDVFPLPKHKKLYYLFDFGDSWTFEIRKKGKGKAPVSGIKYPRVVHEEGPKPKQYTVFEE